MRLTSHKPVIFVSKARGSAEGSDAKGGIGGEDGLNVSTSCLSDLLVSAQKPSMRGETSGHTSWSKRGMYQVVRSGSGPFPGAESKAFYAKRTKLAPRIKPYRRVTHDSQSW